MKKRAKWRCDGKKLKKYEKIQQNNILIILEQENHLCVKQNTTENLYFDSFFLFQ